MRRPRRSPRTAPPPPAPAETRSPSPPRRARPRSATSATLSRGLQQLEARHRARRGRRTCGVLEPGVHIMVLAVRSEEHTSELQSQSNLVCRLLLEKKKSTVSQTHLAHQTTNLNPQHSSLIEQADPSLFRGPQMATASGWIF